MGVAAASRVEQPQPLVLGRAPEHRETHRALDAWPAYRAVLVDAAGTVLIPSEPVADVYLRYAAPFGCSLSQEEVVNRFRRAYNMPWQRSALRYVGDARAFWHHIVFQSTGCDRPEVSEAIYEYYTTAQAWHLAPGAAEALQRLRDGGVLVALVSNFDTRLRPILAALRAEHLFDALAVSAEVRAEKPNPVIFDAAIRDLSALAVTRGTAHAACSTPQHHHNRDAGRPGGDYHALHRAAHRHHGSAHGGHAHSAHTSIWTADYGTSYGSSSWAAALGAGGAAGVYGRGGASPTSSSTRDFSPLQPEQVLHVGDDRRNDVWGARDAGITAWLWGYDCRSWAEVADRVLMGRQADEYYEDL